MKTIGTANLHLLTDENLQRCIGNAALDVYEATHVLRESALVDFALETLATFTDERSRRLGIDRSTATTKVGFLG